MVNLNKVEYEFYVRKNRTYIDIENNGANEYINPLVIVAKEGMKIIAKWEISKTPSEELLLKNNIDPRTRDYKTLIPISIEDNYKRYESSYTEEEKELLRNLLYKCFKLSEEKINLIFGHEDKIAKMINNMEPIQAAQFKLYRIYDDEIGCYFKEFKINSDEKQIVYDELIKELYSSSVINGKAGELDIWQDTKHDDSYSHYYSIDNLYGFNRDDVYKYGGLFYVPKSEELKGREYIIFVILDRIPKYVDNILYFAPIEYPKDSKLTITKIIEDYIYNTFYTVSETTQRRFIAFLQRYCSEKENKYVKTKSYK